jgi:hypothetical protein
LFRFFTLTPEDVAFVDPGRGRGPADRLGLAVALWTMSAIDLSQPFTIHLGVDEPLFARFEDDALLRGMMIFRLDLTGLPDKTALADYLAREFMYPFKTAGLDAAVSLISDLEWFGNTNGHLVIARGLANPSDVGDSFVSILPYITDRWRTQAIPFIVAIDGKDDRLRSSPQDANDRMDESARRPWALPGWLSPHPRASEPSAAVNHLVHRSEPSLDASGIPRLPNKENWAVNGPVRILLVRSRSVVSGHYLSAAANPGIGTPCYLFRPTPVRVHECYIRRSKVRVGTPAALWRDLDMNLRASARAGAGSRASWRRNDVLRRMGSMYV